MAEGFNLKCGCAVSPIPLAEHLFSLTYCAQHNSFTLHKASPGHTSDWIQPTYDHFIAARAAETPADLAARLAEARAELSEAEYLALVGKLSSASNIEAEQEPAEEPTCPRCGSDNVEDVNWMVDAPVDRFSCGDCGFTWERGPAQEEAEKL